MSAAPLTVVTWKWQPKPGRTYRSKFGPETVNVLRRMVARHYPEPHRFVCITDDPAGIDPAVEIVPLWSTFADLESPHGAHQPSCYRRLKLFDPAIAAILGPRFVSLDLDCVITGDLRPLFGRPEPFVMWGDTAARTWYNGSLVLLSAGARPQVWERFDPERSPAQAKAAGCFGSDQGWISYCLGPGEAKFGIPDGVYSYRVHLVPKKGKLPPDARIVFFHGRVDPWSREAQALPWVREHWQ